MDNKLRDSQLTFLGKLLAGYTHELKNHLAVINESSGLMDDLLEMSEVGDEKLHLRFKKIIGTIGERISSANTMAMYLNRVAHRMDFPLSQCNVNNLLIEELALIERFGAMKNISFDKHLQKEIPSIHCNPSLLQFIIFSLVSELIEKIASGTVIQFFSDIKGENIEICIESAGPFIGSGEMIDSRKMSEILDFACGEMGINLHRSRTESGYLKNLLIIPLKDNN